MADPFEVRVRFTHQLQRLNASVASAQKAAAYALRYRDMDEDLHSCILEQLEKNNMNVRANILYFIEHLCDSANRNGHVEFVNMIRRDIQRIVDAVAPSDETGAANVKVARQVLQGLREKGVLEPEVEGQLQARLSQSAAVPRAIPIDGDGPGDGDIHDSVGSGPGSNGGGRPGGGGGGSGAGAGNGSHSARNGTSVSARPSHGLDRKEIEQRIEEDRERHKRLRESMWAIKPDTEHQTIWDEASDVGEDDMVAASEDGALRRRILEFM